MLRGTRFSERRQTGFSILMSEPEPMPIEYVRDRDPQIDELISVLSVHADVLRSINFRLFELNSIDEELANIRRTLREALEKAFAPRPPWYHRFFGWFIRNRMKREMRKFQAEYDKKEAERKAHMQHLAENAHVLSSGRFRSRY